MLQDEFTSVLRARNRDELLAEAVTFTRGFGFETVNATVLVDGCNDGPDHAWVDNTPAAYRPMFEDRARGRRDPVAQYCRRQRLPIVWGQQTYVDNQEGELWEEQACHGYRAGIALALHLPMGLHFYVGVDRDQPLPTDRAEVSRMVADFQLFAVHAQDAAFRVLLPEVRQGDVPSLTPRELETLRWTMEGKTAWELGRILGISEQTAVRHVNNATHKLHCVNKHHAVVKALRMGLM